MKDREKAAAVDITAIEGAIAAAGDEFTVEAVMKMLGAGRSDALRRRVERAIDADGGFFRDGQWHCRTRRSFFTGRKFLITPDEWEISAGILFPGHRFVPFVDEEVFPSAVKLSIGGKAVPMKKVIVPLGSCFHSHILLGSEQIFDFLVADDPANDSLRRGAGRTDSVTLNVFDLAAFYREHDFLFGDALIGEVEDFSGGAVSARYLSGSERGSAARREFFRVMDEAAARVWAEFRDYPDIPEQLAWMVWYAAPEVPEIPGASLDEFIGGSEKVRLRPEGDHAVLTVEEEHHCGDEACGCHDDGEDEEITLPDGLSISAGELSDPMKLLAHAGIPLTAQELDGFMLDAIYGRESDFDGVRSRIFGDSALDLPDEAQQAVLLNFLEERFETMLENYNRADDEPKAELRSQIMEAVSRRLEYLAMLGGSEGELSAAEKERMSKLAAISAKLGEALKLLNHPGFTPDGTERESLAALIDDQLSMQEDLLGDCCSGADQ